VDPVPEVRHETILTLTAIVRQNQALLPREVFSSPSSPTILESIYIELIPRAELRSEIDYGCVKTKVDEHQNTRKASFQLLASLLDVCPYMLDTTVLFLYASIMIFFSATCENCHVGSRMTLMTFSPRLVIFLNVWQTFRRHPPRVTHRRDRLPSLLQEAQHLFWTV